MIKANNVFVQPSPKLKCLVTVRQNANDDENSIEQLRVTGESR